MVNHRTSNLINHIRSATKILKVYSSSFNSVDGSVGSGHERRHGGGGDGGFETIGRWLVGGCARQVGKQEAKIVISDSLAWDNQEST